MATTSTLTMVPTAPIPCTCQAPPVVDLSASTCSVRASDVSYLEGRQENGQGEPSPESSSISSSSLLLKRNLQDYGWTHLVVDVPECPPPTQSQVFQLFEKQEKKEPQQSQGISTSTGQNTCDEPAMTRDNDSSVGGLLTANFPSHVLYRTSESGGTMAVEPKESLEISTANCDDTDANDSDHSSDFDRMVSWCRALQSISQIVRQALQLPPHVLLYEQDPILPSSSQNETDQGTMLDLMRVFYYHRVDDHHQNLPPEQGPTSSSSSSTVAEPLILGSSPHTDWGSFTVVWQDHVGGLQTYCAACQTWNNVKATSTKAMGSQSAAPIAFATDQGPDETTSTISLPRHRWECIVHVGDMTSLAMMLPDTTPVPDPETTNNANIKHCQSAVQWPSPRHRVVSSCTSERASLVYFGYPPSHLSLQQVQQALRDWSLESRGSCLPYDAYYLLKNQSDGRSSSSDNNDTLDANSPSKKAQQEYHSMKSRPLGTVVMEKWRQVQR
jgi:hypothetical protein